MRRLVLGVTLEGDERVRVSSDMVNRVESAEQARTGDSLGGSVTVQMFKKQAAPGVGAACQMMCALQS